MADRACPKCRIVYHMISDNTPDPVCKKCGGPVYYWGSEFEKQLGANVVHDHRWCSFEVRPEDIDPNYVPKK